MGSLQICIGSVSFFMPCNFFAECGIWHICIQLSFHYSIWLKKFFLGAVGSEGLQYLTFQEFQDLQCFCDLSVKRLKDGCLLMMGQNSFDWEEKTGQHCLCSSFTRKNKICAKWQHFITRKSVLRTCQELCWRSVSIVNTNAVCWICLETDRETLHPYRYVCGTQCWALFFFLTTRM